MSTEGRERDIWDWAKGINSFRVKLAGLADEEGQIYDTVVTAHALITIFITTPLLVWGSGKWLVPLRPGAAGITFSLLIHIRFLFSVPVLVLLLTKLLI